MSEAQTALQSRQFHIRRERLRRQEREALRRQRYQRVRLAVEQIAPAHPGIGAVYLFGSLVQPGRYTPRSDVDVAVDCDDPAAESRFWQALEAELETNVDLRPCKGAVARAVRTCGECIYEREIPPAGTQHRA
jgi:predicted nucleotidyltransferase